MDSAQVALVAAVLAAVAAIAAAGVAVMLGRRLRESRQLVDELRSELVPLARQARVAAEHAATELERVGDVLGSAEAVSSTVDAASRLAYRAFANPAVKTVAYATGLRGALRRLAGRPGAWHGPQDRFDRAGPVPGPWLAEGGDGPGGASAMDVGGGTARATGATEGRRSGRRALR